MGEIADAMTSGEMCEACGEPIACGDYGIPMYCSIECARSRGASKDQVCLETFDEEEVDELAGEEL